jgi:hypothetical protein
MCPLDTRRPPARERSRGSRGEMACFADLARKFSARVCAPPDEMRCIARSHQTGERCKHWRWICSCSAEMSPGLPMAWRARPISGATIPRENG